MLAPATAQLLLDCLTLSPTVLVSVSALPLLLAPSATAAPPASGSVPAAEAACAVSSPAPQLAPQLVNSLN